MTVLLRNNEYEAAVEYIRLADMLRLYEQIGREPPATLAEHQHHARARLDYLRPSAKDRRNATRWTSR